MSRVVHTDAVEVARIRSGDETAFNRIYKLHWLRLFRLACRIVEDESVAEDIVQDIFVSFWEKGCHLEINNIEAYLYQSVKFKCFMHLRSGSISRRHLEHFSRLAAEAKNTEEYALTELEDMLQQGIDSLPERCREVFYLSRVQALPNKKIAEKLHISPKTVENQITKALKQLRLSIDKLAVIAGFFLHF